MLFLGLLALALVSDRFWPMWAAAFQLVGTMFVSGCWAPRFRDFGECGTRTV
jgi:hypothetical protein